MFLLIKNIFTSVIEAIEARRNYSRTYNELSRLSDRNLRDMGISRSDIKRVSLESAFKTNK